MSPFKAAAPPEANGDVIKIERRGMRKFALGEGAPVDIDVVAQYNLWWEIDRNFRNEEGKVPPERTTERSQALWAFVRDVFTEQGKQPPDITLTEALVFMKLLGEEADRLRAFFDPSSREEPSSPESTAFRFGE